MHPPCCRYPYLISSTAGFALQETVKRADLRQLGTRLAAGLAAGAWSVPTLILTGDADKFIKVRPGRIGLRAFRSSRYALGPIAH